jgi:hypothetical protein
MAQFPEYMDKTESVICNKLISAILSKGHFVRVYDGTEFATRWTQDRKEIQRETAATDCTWYVVGTMDKEKGKPTRIGSYMLVHGNIEDVVSDIAGKDGDSLTYLEELLPTG